MNGAKKFRLNALKLAALALVAELRSKVGLKDILNNSGWLFFDKAIRAVLGLFVGAWVARYLGPSQFGELSYYLALIAIFQSITTLGMDGIVVREIAKSPALANTILGTVFRMRFLAGIFCWFCVLLGFGLVDSENQEGLWILGIVGASLIFQSGDVVDLWFQGKSQNKRGVYAKLSAYLIANAIKVALIVLGAELMAFAIIAALEAALVALAMGISYAFYPSKNKWLHNWKLAKQLIVESWPYLISGISIMIYMRIDQVMIKEMLGEHQLGLFSAALPFASIWNVIPVTICAVLLPYMTRKKQESSEHFDRYLLYIFRSFWVIALGLILLINVFSHWLITQFYGEAYQEAISVLNIYIITLIPVFLGVGQNIWIINEGKSHLVLIQTVVGGISSVLLNLLFLPIWGIEGAAIAAVTSYFISAVIMNFIFSRALFMLQLGLRLPRVL